MIVELKPEQQKVLDRAVQSGMSPDEGLDQAFAVIHQQIMGMRTGCWPAKRQFQPKSKRALHRRSVVSLWMLTTRRRSFKIAGQKRRIA